MEPKMTRGSILRWTPYAWAKFLFMLYKGKTEIGGYGITATEDPLLITDFKLIKQTCTGVSVELDEKDSSRYAEEMIEAGFEPWQTGRIWIHTHPGDCPEPSHTDEKIFNKYFSICSWAIFFIMARGGKKYCVLRNNVGPGVEAFLDTEVDFTQPFLASDHEEWEKEYKSMVNVVEINIGKNNKNNKYKIVDNRENRGNLWDDPEEMSMGYDFGFLDEVPDRLDDEDEFETEMDELYSSLNNDEDEEIFIKDGIVFYWHEDEECYYYYNPNENKFYDENNCQIKYDKNNEFMAFMKEWAEANYITETDNSEDIQIIVEG